MDGINTNPEPEVERDGVLRFPENRSVDGINNEPVMGEEKSNLLQFPEKERSVDGVTKKIYPANDNPGTRPIYIKTNGPIGVGRIPLPQAANDNGPQQRRTSRLTDLEQELRNKFHSFLQREEVQPLKEVFDKAKLPLNVETLADLKANPPEKAEFPFLIFEIALIKDSLDIVLGILVVTHWASTLFGFISGIILGIWYWNKVSSLEQKAVKMIAKNRLKNATVDISKSQFRKLAIKLAEGRFKKFTAAGVADIVPILDLIPFNVIFVLQAYAGEKELSQKIEKALEEYDKVFNFMQKHKIAEMLFEAVELAA